MTVTDKVVEIVRKDPRTELLFGLIRSAAKIEGASDRKLQEALARAALDILATSAEAQSVIVGDYDIFKN